MAELAMCVLSEAGLLQVKCDVMEEKAMTVLNTIVDHLMLADCHTQPAPPAQPSPTNTLHCKLLTCSHDLNTGLPIYSTASYGT